MTGVLEMGFLAFGVLIIGLGLGGLQHGRPPAAAAPRLLLVAVGVLVAGAGLAAVLT